MKLRIHSLPTFITMILCSSMISCQTKWQGKKITLPKISKEIISLRKDDQKYRMKYIKLSKAGKNGTKEYEKVVKKLIDIDRSNTARMEEIINEHGWPTFDKVGEKGSNIAWLIVQHADRNPLFQEKCLKLMQKELENKRINPSNYAYLFDRVRLAKGEKQLYGTQSTTNHNLSASKANFQPIEDESNVQKRREEMNIDQHIEHYALSLNFDYTVPSAQEAIERAKQYETSYQVNIDKANTAMLNKAYKEAVKLYTEALYSDGYTKPEDYVEVARAISLAQHDDMDWASYYLLKAVFKGYKHLDDFDSNPDFKNLKNANLDSWEKDLMTTIKKMKI